jgi:hypothetical protein
MPRLAVRGDVVASTGTTPTFQLLRLDRVEDPEVLRWHRHEVLALGWAAGALVTGDAGGRVSLWEQ